MNLKLLINTSCNLKCTFCHNEFQGNTIGTQKDKFKIYDEERLRGIFTCFLNTKSDEYNLKISGGEPLLMPSEVVKVLRIASEFPFNKKILISNLAQKRTNVLRDIVELGIDEIRVNIPSFSKVEYMMIVGGGLSTLDNVLSNCAYLSSLGVALRLNVVVVNEEDVAGFMTLYIEKVLQLNMFKHITFIVNDRSEKKKLIFNEMISILARMSGHSEVRRGRIYEIYYSTIIISASMCSDWDETEENDWYFRPPGDRFLNFVRGKAYND